MDGPAHDPTDFTRRSFHYRALAADGAHFAALADCAVAASYGNSVEEEADRAARMGLVDLTPLPRTGFRGPGALAWLRAVGLTVPETSNLAAVQAGGAVLGRLADSEAVLLGDLARRSDICERLEARLASEAPASCHLVPRQDASAWLLVTGSHADAMFAKLCGVDLRCSRFPEGSIAQTSVARMSAMLLRQDVGSVPAWHLLFDSAAADYMWRVLKDAMNEFGGGPVGYYALARLARR